MRSPIGALGALLNRAPVPYVSRATSYARPFLAPSGQEAQMRAMGSVGTLFAIVDRTANATAQVEWKLWRKAKSGLKEDRTEVTSHAALDLWNKPNKFFTRQEFVETFQQHHDLTGEAWWVIARNPRAAIPLELWPVRPDRMQPVPHPTDYLTGYMYTGPSGEQVPLRTEDVIFLRRPNPLDAYRGMGPVQSILADLDATRYSAEWNRNFFLNSAEPGGIVELPEHLGDNEWDELLERWDEQHKGVANAHRVAFLEHGKWVDRKYTQRDMQFVELRGVSREVIREAYGIPKFAVGDIDDVNRATAEASKTWFAEQLTCPRLERIKGALNNDLLPLFGATVQGLEFDYESPVPADREADARDLEVKAAAAKILIEAGFSAESVREAVGLPEMEAAPSVGGDGTISPRELADMVQSIYLGVGTVLTWEEAREVCNRAGAGLDLSVPPPEGLRPARSPRPRSLPAAEPEPGEAEDVIEARLERLAAILTRAREPRPALVRGQSEDDEEEGDAELARVRDQFEAALERLLEDWQPITEAQRDDLIDQIRRAVEDGDTEALADLTAGSSEAAAVLTAALVAMYGTAGAQMAAEAAAQGVEVEPPAADEEGLGAIATAVALLLAAGLAAAAGREALRLAVPGATAAAVASGVRTFLEGMSDRGLRDELGGALHRAQNAARLDTLEVAPRAKYVASEKNDQNTCQPCSKIDGTGFASLAAARAEYGAGGYRLCEGGIRCRGTVVARWEGN